MVRTFGWFSLGVTPSGNNQASRNPASCDAPGT